MDESCVKTQDLAHKLAEVVTQEAAQFGVPGTAVLAGVRSAEVDTAATFLQVRRPAPCSVAPESLSTRPAHLHLGGARHCDATLGPAALLGVRCCGSPVCQRHTLRLSSSHCCCVPATQQHCDRSCWTIS